jgi:hypothetical protein
LRQPNVIGIVLSAYQEASPHEPPSRGPDVSTAWPMILDTTPLEALPDDPVPAGQPGERVIAETLDALRLLWDDKYLVGYDDDLGWWASRRGVIGHIITAETPDELDRQLIDEHGPGR